MNRSINLVVLSFVTSVVLLADQIIKYFVYKEIPQSGFLLFKNNVFAVNFVHQLNENVAFSLPTGRVVSVIVSAALICAVVWMFVKNRNCLSRQLSVLVALVIGSALSNLIDRVRFGGVFDFFSIQVAGISWPTFNLADAIISLSAVYLIILLIRKEGYEKNINCHNISDRN